MQCARYVMESHSIHNIWLTHGKKTGISAQNLTLALYRPGYLRVTDMTRIISLKTLLFVQVVLARSLQKALNPESMSNLKHEVKW